MAVRLVFIALCFSLIPLAIAGNLTEQNEAKTGKIIAKLVERYGGSDTLSSLDSIVVKHDNVFVSVGQSKKPTPPWDTSTATGVSAIDLAAERFAISNRGSGGGFEYHEATLINDTQSYELDYRSGYARPIEDPNYEQSTGPFVRVTPVLLVKALQDHARTAHFLGKASIEDREHYVVRFAMNQGPAISLYVDVNSHLITHSERIVPGFGMISYDFHDYEIISGIPFNRTFQLHQDGELSMKRTNQSISVNQSIDPYLSIDQSLTVTSPIPEDPMSLREVADGVYLIGGNRTYGMFVEMEDHVIAVGGVAGLNDRLEELRRVTQKPVKYGVLTHHHSDHLLAVSGYADIGATVVTPTAHETVVSEAAGDVDVTIKTVDSKLLLSDGSRDVVILDIGPTPHSEHLLVTWLPKERVLFEADHFSMPLVGPVPPAVDSTRGFADALTRLALEPTLILSAHSPRPGTMLDLAASLDRTSKKVTMVSDAR
ncbi:MAG: MBL fold metallo-hydrolase [Pseudomonadota bacterium]